MCGQRPLPLELSRALHLAFAFLPGGFPKCVAYQLPPNRLS
jgi:hypothetical protein